MNYTNNFDNFSYLEVYANAAANAPRENKEYYLRAGSARRIPQWIQLLNYYFLLNDIAVYIPTTERITRSTALHYYFDTLTRNTAPQFENTNYNRPLLFANSQIDAFNLKDLFTVRLIEVNGQVQDTFETSIPAWARDTEATELLGVSLALKLTPKHRIRVYLRDRHIVVFTTKGLSDGYDNDYRLYRKLWAALPLIRGWVEHNQDGEFDELINICKALDKDDATLFKTLLETAYANNPIIKDAKYANVIQAFDNLSEARYNATVRKLEEIRVSLDRKIEEYTNLLTNKTAVEKDLLALKQSEVKIDVETIKMLVDKKICYNLNISRINDPEVRISYVCAAPLLSYDKTAAQNLYKRRIKDNGNHELEKIFKLLFIDEKVMLMFEQPIDLKLTQHRLTSRVNETYTHCDRDKMLPNPHHYFFNCWGSYAPVISNLLQEFKLEETFYQIKAAMGSLNFSDPPVINKFIECLEQITAEIFNPSCFYWRDENCTTAHTLTETLQHFTEEATE